jgi:hypothetical protein
MCPAPYGSKSGKTQKEPMLVASRRTNPRDWGGLKLGMAAGRWVLSSRYNQGTGEAGGAALTLMQWDVGRCGPPSPQLMQGRARWYQGRQQRRDALQRRG